MNNKMIIELRNLAFHFFKDEPAYESYIKAMESIFASHLKSEPKLIFSGNGKDAEEHIKICKIKKCKTCVDLKAFLKRCEEGNVEDEIKKELHKDYNG